MSNVFTKAANNIRYWWLYTLLGAGLVAAGVFVFQTPEESYTGLSVLFSIVVLVNAIFDISFSISNRKYLKDWGWYLAAGILKLAIGATLIAKPEVTMYLLPYLISFWVLLTGGSMVATSLDLKAYFIKGWGYLFALGLLLVAFGVAIIFQPEIGAATLVALTGMALIFAGVAYIYFSNKLRQIKSFVTNNIKDMKSKISKEINNIKETLETNEQTIATEQ